MMMIARRLISFLLLLYVYCIQQQALGLHNNATDVRVRPDSGGTQMRAATREKIWLTRMIGMSDARQISEIEKKMSKNVWEREMVRFCKLERYAVSATLAFIKVSKEPSPDKLFVSGQMYD